VFDNYIIVNHPHEVPNLPQYFVEHKWRYFVHKN